LTGTNTSQPQKSLPKSVALPYLVPHPCRCAAKGKVSAQFGDFWRRAGNIDNDEIRLTSVRLVGIQGDLGAKSRRAKSQRSLIQRTDGSSEHGRLPASCFCCRTELLVGKIGDWRLFHIAWLQGKGTGIDALEPAELEKAPIIPYSPSMPNTVRKSLPTPAGQCLAAVVFCLQWYKRKVHGDLEEKVLTLSRPGLAFCPLSAAAPFV
jgi:hypothetical protein